MKYQFDEVFRKNANGSLSPIRRIRVGGVSFGPKLSFGPAAAFGGVNFHQFIDHPLEVEEKKDGLWIVKGIY